MQAEDAAHPDSAQMGLGLDQDESSVRQRGNDYQTSLKPVGQKLRRPAGMHCDYDGPIDHYVTLSKCHGTISRMQMAVER